MLGSLGLTYEIKAYMLPTVPNMYNEYCKRLAAIVMRCHSRAVWLPCVLSP